MQPIPGIKKQTLDDLRNPLERGIFESRYRSLEQRRLRFLALLMLSIKHAGRGLLFLWPAYVAGIGGLILRPQQRGLFLAILLPGIAVSLFIFAKGVRTDYGTIVRGRLLSHECLIPLLVR
ncbi:MAG: hypothetical protein KDH88_15740 [Chromatiales bacterium]|nr:hypothetical protein [Chromatiales bacterium]